MKETNGWCEKEEIDRRNPHVLSWSEFVKGAFSQIGKSSVIRWGYQDIFVLV